MHRIYWAVMNTGPWRVWQQHAGQEPELISAYWRPKSAYNIARATRLVMSVAGNTTSTVWVACWWALR